MGEIMARGVAFVFLALGVGVAVACSSTPSPVGPAACVAGTTLACTGPGGCSGGQACLPSGDGYGACLCSDAGGNDGGVVDSGVDAPPDLDASGDGAPDADVDAAPPCSSLRVPIAVDVVGPTFDVLQGGASACYEGWAKLAPTGAPGVGFPAIAFSQGGNVVGQGGWLVYCYPNLLTADVYTSGGAMTITATRACDDGAFHHLALCFDGGAFELYYDGALAGTSTGVPANPTLAFHIGSWGDYPDRGTATVDEVRVSTNHRYTAAFTPAKRLTADATTKHLYHFDEGAGTTAADATGASNVTLPVASLWSTSCP